MIRREKRKLKRFLKISAVILSIVALMTLVFYNGKYPQEKTEINITEKVLDK
jgi:hypothetical protein